MIEEITLVRQRILSMPPFDILLSYTLLSICASCTSCFTCKTNDLNDNLQGCFCKPRNVLIMSSSGVVIVQVLENGVAKVQSRGKSVVGFLT